MKRNLAIDSLRILACILVVLIHSPLSSKNSSGMFLCMISYIAAPSIGLLFMVSGALLLPVKGDYFTFLKRRFSKIVWPTLFWTIVYLGLRSLKTGVDPSIVRNLVSIPFSVQGNGVLWFMYTLSGLYLIAPILGAWLKNAQKSEVELVLAIWGVTLCYPLISQYILVDTTIYGALYYFTGYAGYFLLGYYLNKYREQISRRFYIGAFIIAIVGPIFLLYLKYNQIPFEFYSLFWNQSIFIVAACIVIWHAVQSIFHRWHLKNEVIINGIILLSNLSFGIYLIHILIMREWLWNQDWIQTIHNYPLQSMVVAVITFALSTLSTYLISKLPVSKWIIGS